MYVPSPPRLVSRSTKCDYIQSEAATTTLDGATLRTSRNHLGGYYELDGCPVIWKGLAIPKALTDGE
jgi:hypothetical protein